MLLVPEVDKPYSALLKPETDHAGLILRGLIPTPTSQRGRKEDPIEGRKLEREMGEGEMEGGGKGGRGRRRAQVGYCCVRAESKEEPASQRWFCGDDQLRSTG